MKQIRTAHIDVLEADRLAGRQLGRGLWALVLGKLHNSEIRMDPQTGVIHYPEFIPFEELVRDVLRRIDAGEITPRTCRSCRGTFDVNEEEGIFGDLDALENFLCRPCSETVTAREFYEKYLKLP